jgi:hypothetical protein
MDREYVYHYTSAETAVEYILKNRSLKMSSLAAVNDPKESKYRDFVFYARGVRSAASFRESNFDRIVSDLTERTFAFCAGTEANPERRGVEGALRPHMWANYADGHKGVCLVFDKAALQECFECLNENNYLFSGPVSYHDLESYRSITTPAYSMYLEDWLSDEQGYLDYHICNYHNQMFFTKHIDWRDENEFRWVCRSENSDEKFVDFGDALIKVVVGVDISMDRRQKILEWCKSQSIPMHTVIWHATGSLSQDLAASEESNTINLDASYSTAVPSSAVLFRVTNHAGQFISIAISSKNGAVVYVGGDTGVTSENIVTALGFQMADAEVDIKPNGFSAGRLSESQRPLMVNFDSGKMVIDESEEQPYYGYSQLD